MLFCDIQNRMIDAHNFDINSSHRVIDQSLVGKLRNYLKNSFVPIVQLLQKVKKCYYCRSNKEYEAIDRDVYKHQ